MKLAGIFKDHMVLQRNKEIPIWGTAAGGTVTAELCGHKKSAEIKSGSWFIKLPSLKEGGPFEMKVTDGNELITVKDIYIGDVYIAGGQSNMEFVLKDSIGGDNEAATANYPLIRYYNVPRIEEADMIEAEKDTGAWAICSPENAPNFSAVAFYFVKYLKNVINVPIGIINCNWGGTYAACWMSESYLKQNELSVYLDEYDNFIQALDMDEYKKEKETYKNAIKLWLEKDAQFKTQKRKPEEYKDFVGDYPWPPPMGPDSFRRPCGLYYTMLKQITPFSSAGVIWYQGESDTNKAGIYKKLFSEMIKNWRADFENPKLPFLFIQISSYGSTYEDEDWPLLREQQALVERDVSDTGMVVSIDYGDKTDIHPKDKKPIGERLAILALNKIYGKDLCCHGPVFKQIKAEGDKLIITFDNCDGGLFKKGEFLKGFEIGDENGFHEAEAEIDGKKIIIGYKGKPAVVRYAWKNYTEPNLYNKQGFPAVPFRI